MVPRPSLSESLSRVSSIPVIDAYVRVEMMLMSWVDTTLFPAPEDIDDDLLILMADVWPTGWYAAKTAHGMLNEIERVDAVAVVIG